MVVGALVGECLTMASVLWLLCVRERKVHVTMARTTIARPDPH